MYSRCSSGGEAAHRDPAHTQPRTNDKQCYGRSRPYRWRANDIRSPKVEGAIDSVAAIGEDNIEPYTGERGPSREAVHTLEGIVMEVSERGECGHACDHQENESDDGDRMLEPLDQHVIVTPV